MEEDKVKIYFKWIKTEDEVPEDDERVLAKMKDRAGWDWTVRVWNEHYNCWDDEDGDDYECDREDVEVWMRIKEHGRD